MRRLSASVILLGIVLAACAQAPETGRAQLILVSGEQMDQAGAQAYRKVLRDQVVSSDPVLKQRVTGIGQRIARLVDAGIGWEFTVLEEPTPNAFALPGGKVALNTGMFTVIQNDDQLAAVLGHEIAHVMARHSAERVSQQILQQGGLQALGVAVGDPALVQGVATLAVVGITLPYSRTQEAEADEIGLMYMARAGYDPRQAIVLWQNMQSVGGGGVEFLSTHPSDETRIARLRALMPRAMAAYQAARQRS